MRKKTEIILTGLISFLMFNVTAFGIDPNDNIMRNDHDTLLIGVITELDDDEVVIEAIDYIISAYDLFEGAAQRQLRPEVVRVANNEQMSGFNLDDYVLASLNQEGELFVIAWGIYRIDQVDELDWQVWRVEADEITSIILSDFVNQEGRYTYSIRQDGTIVRHQGDAEIIIYDPDPPTEIQPRTDEEDETDEEIVERENEDDGSSIAPVYVLSSIAFCGLVLAGGWMYFKKSKEL